MGEKQQTSNSRKMPAILLGVIGLIIVLAGVAIATIHNALRGSGLGTISIGIGIVLMVIALLRFNVKRAK